MSSSFQSNLVHSTCPGDKSCDMRCRAGCAMSCDRKRTVEYTERSDELNGPHYWVARFVCSVRIPKRAMSNVQDWSTAFHTSLRNVQTPEEIQ